MMRILVLGKDGMLGHRVYHVLQTWYEDVVGIGRDSGLDATSDSAADAVVLYYAPDVTVNCVGSIKQKRLDRETCFKVNTLFPQCLQRVCEQTGSRLIHFSTDCVFSGERGNYTEADKSDVSDIYGVSKFLGEVSGPNALTLRTSFIGHELNSSNGLLEWFLTQKNRLVPGYTNAIFSGVTTNWMADAVALLIEKFPTLSGLYHITSQKPISKYDLLRKLQLAYEQDCFVFSDQTVRYDRSMIGKKFEEVTGIARPCWPELINQLLWDGRQ